MLRLIVFLCLVLFLSVASPVNAARLSFVVNDSSDLPDAVINGVCETADGQCTLRAALDEINAVGHGRHVVTIGAMTIGLNSPLTVEPGVRVSIRGAGAGQTTLDGQWHTRIFNIPANAALNLADVTLTLGNGGDKGGALLNAGTVVLNHVVLYFNRAPSLYNGGVGGGIYNEASGVLTIRYSTIENNEARSVGGGIYNAGHMTLTHSTVSGNRNVNGGGGILNKGTVTIANSTLAGNSTHVGGAISNQGGSIIIRSSTIAGNGASEGTGIYNGGGSVIVASTIIAGSDMGSNCAGSITSYGFNLSSDLTCGLTRSGDRQGVDPLLGLLADNGGPTKTLALLVGSPAIDAGLCAGAVDQRGYRRHVNIPFVPNVVSTCDIGAYEFQR